MIVGSSRIEKRVKIQSRVIFNRQHRFPPDPRYRPELFIEDGANLEVPGSASAGVQTRAGRVRVIVAEFTLACEQMVLDSAGKDWRGGGRRYGFELVHYRRMRW